MRLAYDWDWLKAQNDFQQALKLNPKYPTAHQWYASYLMQMGKFSLAKAEIEEAHKLDPLSPIISANNGLYSYYEHNYDDAIAKYKVTLQSDPDFWVARHYHLRSRTCKECTRMRSRSYATDQGAGEWSDTGQGC